MPVLGLCCSRSAELVGPQAWDARLLLLCCPSIPQAGITLLLLLSPWVRASDSEGHSSRPSKPLTIQVCTAVLVQAGAGAEGIARLIREQNIYCEEALVGSGKQSLPKEQTPGKEFCKLNVGTSNGHKLAVNKFGLEVKF